MLLAATLGVAVIDVRAEEIGGSGWSEEIASSCLDWHSEQLDVVEGRYEAYRELPDVRWAMGSLPLGLGMVRTVIELRWRDAVPVALDSPGTLTPEGERGRAVTQTLFDAISASEFAGGLSFYRSENGLHVDYPRCEWGTGVCETVSRHYLYSTASGQFVGADPTSADALLHLCPPAYFAARQASSAGSREVLAR